MSFLDDWKEWSTPKKAISIIAVCCVAVFIIAMIGGSTSPDKNTSGDVNLNLVDTNHVKVDGSAISIDGYYVADVKEYDNSSAIEDVILSQEGEIIIKEITDSGATEVTSVDDYNAVHEFLTDDGMYYTFAKDGKTYIITMGHDWYGNNRGKINNALGNMDDFCLENAK